jgi:hypothetical protein
MSIPKKTYPTPAAFHRALEDRIKTAARSKGHSIHRLRQTLIYDRLLARVFQIFGDRVVVKGGVALELRIERARTTKDVDLRITGDPSQVLTDLLTAGRLDLGDYLSFRVKPDARHPDISGDGVVYAGLRFQVNAELAGRPYGSPCGVDVGVADCMEELPDIVSGSRFFEFIGLAPPKLRVYPRAVHVAEKLHAYSLPRDEENSRVKDLPDLALLAMTGEMDATRLRAALEATFSFRKSHALPQALPQPPRSTRWSHEYARLAQESDLPWRTLPEVFDAASRFLNPVLSGTRGSWDPGSWTWRS